MDWVAHQILCPCNSPGENTTVSNHSLPQGIFPTQGSNPGLPHCRRILDQLSHQGSPETYSFTHPDNSTHRLYSPWNCSGQNTEVGSLSLLQGIFPTQGLNPGLPHCRRILDQLSHKGRSPISTKLTLKEMLKFLF